MAKKKIAFRIMTANILRFEDKRNLLGKEFVTGYRNYFKKYNPTVICMQEYEHMINKDTFRDPKQELFEPDYQVVDNLDANMENHCAIAIQGELFDYVEMPIGHNANLQKGYWYVEKNPICICNVHLDSNRESARQEQMAEILKILEKEKNVVLTGDFNSQNFNLFVNAYENNLFNRFESVEEIQLDQNGNEQEREGSLTSQWISVMPNMVYRASGFKKICFYNSDKKSLGFGENGVISIPMGCSYVRMDCKRMNADKSYLVMGNDEPKPRKTYKIANRGELGDFWSWDWWGDYDHEKAERIDNVIVSSNIQIENVIMTETLTSDHHALVVDLSLT